MLSFFPRDVLDENLDLIESVSEGFPTYFFSVWLPPQYGGSLSCLVLNSMVELHRVQSPVNVIDRRQEVRPKLV